MPEDVLYTCSNCGPTPPGSKCPTCGGDIVVKMTLRAQISTTAKMKHTVTSRDNSGRETYVETKGDTYTRKNRSWSVLWRLIDYVSKHYAELVVGGDGTVHKFKKGKLQDQTLHGGPTEELPHGPIRELENLD